MKTEAIKPVGRRQENSRRQRSAILAAAVSVFSQKGFHTAEVGEIAKRAGVGKGTIYLYFEDKSQLFAAAVAEGIESIIKQLRGELESDLPFLRHLRRLVEKNVSLYLESGDLTRIFHNELSRGIERRSRDQIDRARSRYLDFISATLADGHRLGYLRKADFDLAAVGLVGMLDSLCNHQLHNSGRVTQDQIVNTVFELLAVGMIEKERSRKAPALRPAAAGKNFSGGKR